MLTIPAQFLDTEEKDPFQAQKENQAQKDLKVEYSTNFNI